MGRLAVALLVWLAAGTAGAQEEEEAAPAPAPAAETPAAAPQAEAALPLEGMEEPVDIEYPVAKQEIGVRLGAQLGLSSLTPGGFRIGAIYLYRLDDNTWFDGEAATSFGSGSSECFYSRAESLTLVCNHGGLDGFSMGLSGGVRMFFAPRPSGFHPYVRAGAGLSYAGFSGDGVSGAVLFGYGGAGLRFRVAPRLAVGGEALLLLGPGLYDSGLGLRLLGGLVVQFGVEFAL